MEMVKLPPRSMTPSEVEEIKKQVQALLRDRELHIDRITSLTNLLVQEEERSKSRGQQLLEHSHELKKFRGYTGGQEGPSFYHRLIDERNKLQADLKRETELHKNTVMFANREFNILTERILAIRRALHAGKTVGEMTDLLRLPIEKTVVK